MSVCNTGNLNCHLFGQSIGGEKGGRMDIGGNVNICVFSEPKGQGHQEKYI